jgi:hypothetical protein
MLSFSSCLHGVSVLTQPAADVACMVCMCMDGLCHDFVLFGCAFGCPDVEG